MPNRAPMNELEPKRVCIIKPSALGDVVQSLPLLSGLKQRWPGAHFSWVIRSGLAGLLQDHPELDRVIEFQRQGSFPAKALSFVQLLRRLRECRFDLAIDLQGLLRSGLMTWMTQAPRRIGFTSAREGSRCAYNDRVAVDWNENLGVHCYWQMARAFGCEGAPPPARFGLTERHRAWAREKIQKLPRPVLMVHPGAQWVTKRWPREHFALLADSAQRTLGTGIVLIGGPREVPLCAEIARRLGDDGVVNLAGQTELLQLAAVLMQGDVLLSGDTGPMHLAAAVGTPVVSVFTCTSPRRSGPFGPGHRTIATRVSCAASYLKRCSSMVCMSELVPMRVWPALEAALLGQAPIAV